jgi:hypothetical protein
MDIAALFGTPKIIGVIADVNAGKSNLLHWLVRQASERYDCDIYQYGMKGDTPATAIHSLSELEAISGSIVIIDEFHTLFDLEDRKNRKSIEQTLRLLHHSNNVILLAGLPDNYKKFISGRLDMIAYMRCGIADFINGSRAKAVALAYRGSELGSAVLSVPKGSCLLWDGLRYRLHAVPYVEDCDSKRGNAPILREKRAEKCAEKCAENAQIACDIKN